MKLTIVGPHDSGKDRAAEFLRDHHGFRFTGSCSTQIAPRIAARLGITTAEAYARRHEDTALWRREGDLMRANDPAYLARHTLKDGDLCVGVRSLREIRAVRSEGLTELIIWIDRDVSEDDTLEFGSEEADIVIENKGTLADFHARLDRLARTWGLSP